MTTGLSTDLPDTSDARKTAVINNELLRLEVDIAALQETRLAETSSFQEKDFTFFWRGKPARETTEYNVGFAVKNSLLNVIEPGEVGTESIPAPRLHTTTSTPRPSTLPRRQKTSSTTSRSQSSRKSQPPKACFYSATSMHESAPTTPPGRDVWDDLESAA